MRSFRVDSVPGAPATPLDATQKAARASIEGRSRGLRALLPFLGPAFIACVAYVDPGNFATNIAGGAQFGYNLLWVILLANLIGMLIQNLSAKVGIATGRNLAEVCPTGVFDDKPFSEFFSRKWDLRSVPSVCIHCGLGCNTMLSWG